MKAETAKILIEAIENATSIAIDNRNRLTAFESLLQKQNASLFQDYEDVLYAVREHPPTLLVPEVFSKLLLMLVQDQS
jgi:hypothetical protein